MSEGQSFEHYKSIEDLSLEASDAFRNLGSESPEAIELYNKFCEKLEIMVEADPDNRRLQLDLELSRATLLSDAGLLREARQALYDAQDIADGEGLKDLADQIEDKIGVTNQKIKSIEDSN